MQNTRENTQRLPGHAFPNSLSVAGDIDEAVSGAAAIFIVSPSHAAEDLARDAARAAPPHTPFILCAKGLSANGEFLSERIARHRSEAPVLVLSGPSFAHEVAASCYTIVSLSGPEGPARDLCSWLSSETFVMMPCDDIRAVQIAGVFKNVAAILCGACDGLEAGANARAALMSEAIREASEFVQACGGDPITLLGPAGFGDFALTCTDSQSRNHRLGRQLALGTVEGNDTHEGAANAAALARRAGELGVDVPLARAVAALVAGRIDADEAVRASFAQRFKKSQRARKAA